MNQQQLTRAILAACVPFALSACQRGVQVTSPGAPTPSGSQAVVVATTGAAVPAGTVVQARLDQELSTSNSQEGQRFTASLLSPILNAQRETVVPAGARINGTVTALRKSIDVASPAIIRLDFQTINWGNRSVPLSAEITATQAETRGGGITEALRGTAAGAAAGAALGAVIGRDVQGALTGAAIGAAAGTAISLGTQDQAGVLPRGTTMTLRLTEPLPLGR